MNLRLITAVIITIAVGILNAMPLSIPGSITPGIILSASDDSPSSNAIGDIEFNAYSGDIWVSTGRGLAVSRDGGETWESKLPDIGFAALSILGDWVWAAASYDFEDPTDPNNSLPAGDGFYISFDGGETFEHCTQATSANGVGKLAYDLAIIPDGEDTIVYASCFYGGLIFSSDRGASWQSVFPDGSDSLSYSDLGHRFFSVTADTSVNPPVVWAGSARGLYFGREGTFAWDKVDTTGHWIPDSIPIFDTTWVDSTTFEVDSVSNYYISWRRDSMDIGALSGNWIISLDFQYSTETGIFACSRYTSSNSAGSDYDAISYSFNGGSTWEQTGEGFVSWNMGFTGDTLWMACRHGLSRAFAPDYDTVETLTVSGLDVNSGGYIDIDILKEEVVSATDCGGVLYVGTYSEGIARTSDGGETWEIVANFPSAEEASTQDPNAADGSSDYVYAFPNPYSPRYHESCFFVFDSEGGGLAKIELFDYDINKVATILWDAVPQNGKNRIQWNGKLENGIEPDNGLYFFRVETDSGDRWGKLMIIK
ncbi:hypothetical protein KAH81_08795 [bacterium]|nr:hypothetical protein [bacterium]